MKQHALGLAIATVAFAGSSLYLWTQLRQERAHVAQVEETGRRSMRASPSSKRRAGNSR